MSIPNRSFSSLVLNGLLLVLTATALMAAPVPYKGDGWSEPVNGIQARFSFGPGEVLGGTRVITIYLELHNVSGMIDPLYFNYHSSLVTGQVYDSAGKPVPQTGGILDRFGGPDIYLLGLPSDATLKLNVTSTGWGVMTDQKAHIETSNGNWEIKPGDNAEYYLGGSFTSAGRPQNPPKDMRIWAGKIEIPKVRIDVLNPKEAEKK